MDARTECRAFGAIDNSNVTRLASVLRGMCIKYGGYEVHEVVMRTPLDAAGNASSTLKLVRRIVNPGAVKAANNPFTDKPTDRWLAVHEGLPMRGQTAAHLPASVREITESYCYSANVPDFWKGIGAVPEYGLVKKGHEYICHHMGHELRALLLHVLTLPSPMGPLDSARNTSGKYILDVSCRVPSGQHVEGSAAVGSFAAKLAPLATLQPAMAPI